MKSKYCLLFYSLITTAYSYSQTECRCIHNKFHTNKIVYFEDLFINSTIYLNQIEFQIDSFYRAKKSVFLISNGDTFKIFNTTGFSRKDTFSFIEFIKIQEHSTLPIIFYLIPDTIYKIKEIKVYRYIVFREINSTINKATLFPKEIYDIYDLIIGYGFVRYNSTDKSSVLFDEIDLKECFKKVKLYNRKLK